MKRLIILVFLCVCISVQAQDFNKFFKDSTLRLDYIFSGNAFKQEIAFSKAYFYPRWYGKTHKLAQVPVKGNGQIIVTDKATGMVIYSQSFSTLFQEWLTYPEAKNLNRAFENVILIPYPKEVVNIKIVLRDKYQQDVVVFNQSLNPKDILIRQLNKTNDYVTLLKPQDSTKCVRIAFLAEGYTDKEMPLFLADANKAVEALFSYEPFKSNKHNFEVVAVKAVSKDSGTSIPSQKIWKNTALSSHFDTFYSDRYLTTLNLEDVHNNLACTPYEHIIILVNTSEYGGGGILNCYNLSMTHHPLYEKVVVHEFGHSFAGLADEYAYEHEQIDMYPLNLEPWEPNITTKVNFDSKWKNMVGENGVGLYEGAGYSIKGIYRPCKDCRMRSNETPNFCPVCQKAIQKVIDFYIK